MNGLLVAAAIAVGAGGALAVTAARTEAAGYAITHALVVGNLVKNCEKFRDKLQSDPDAALAAWRLKNAEHVVAAESYLVAARTAVERQHGAQAGEDFHAQTHGLFVRQANQTLNDIFGALGPHTAVCERWLEAIGGGQADLNWQSKYMPALEELRAFERSLRPGR